LHFFAVFLFHRSGNAGAADLARAGLFKLGAAKDEANRALVRGECGVDALKCACDLGFGIVERVILAVDVKQMLDVPDQMSVLLVGTVGKAVDFLLFYLAVADAAKDMPTRRGANVNGEIGCHMILHSAAVSGGTKKFESLWGKGRDGHAPPSYTLRSLYHVFSFLSTTVRKVAKSKCYPHQMHRDEQKATEHGWKKGVLGGRSVFPKPTQYLKLISFLYSFGLHPSSFWNT
jgi:hypothetical protein